MDEDEMLETTNESEKVETRATEESEAEENSNPSEFTDKVEEENKLEFTQKELDRFVKDRLSRQETKIREEFEQKYGRLETIVNAGLRNQ